MEGYSTQPFLLQLNSYKFHAPAAKVHSIRQRAFDRGWGGGGGGGELHSFLTFTKYGQGE